MTSKFLEDFREVIQETGLCILSKHRGGFQFTNTFFPYTSGEIGPYYVQSGVVQNNGADYNLAVKNMSKLVEMIVGDDELSKVVISGGETRDWIFSNPTAVTLGVPHLMLYKDGKSVGADVKGKEVVHIADLNNEGSSPRDYWIPAIKKAGRTINDIFFYVDRMEEGVQVMEDLRLVRNAVVPLNEHAWEYLQKKGVVSAEIYKNLMARGKSEEERDAWARSMLKSDAGLARLVQLFDSDKDREKVRKIVNKGYLDMGGELVEVIKQRSHAKINVDEWLAGM